MTIKWKKTQEGYVWINPNGEDTYVSHCPGQHVNESPNQGEWFIAHNGDLVGDGKRTFKTAQTAKAYAEKLIRKSTRKK